jgi:hypothetical protein
MCESIQAKSEFREIFPSPLNVSKAFQALPFHLYSKPRSFSAGMRVSSSGWLCCLEKCVQPKSPRKAKEEKTFVNAIINPSPCCSRQREELGNYVNVKNLIFFAVVFRIPFVFPLLPPCSLTLRC